MSLTSISPISGASSGSTTVTLNGSGFNNVTNVYFNNTEAISYFIISDSVITAVSPPGQGVISIYVRTSTNRSNAITFIYILAPYITKLSEVEGPITGGNTITISGYYLSKLINVVVGSNIATHTLISDSTIEIIVPEATLAVTNNVIVTTVGGTSNILKYNYINSPTITLISPASGPVTGGTNITITGENFTTTNFVSFENIIAPYDLIYAPFNVISDTIINVTIPPRNAGNCYIFIYTSGGFVFNNFTYTYPPII